jgi:hypothetical protein
MPVQRALSRSSTTAASKRLQTLMLLMLLLLLQTQQQRWQRVGLYVRGLLGPGCQ